MSYVPEVNDYVKWIDRKNVEGWVYFKDNQYITIETQVWPKHPEDLPNGTYHRNDRVLVLCYKDQWNQLEYVRTRKSTHEEEKNTLETVGKSIGRESEQR